MDNLRLIYKRKLVRNDSLPFTSMERISNRIKSRERVNNAKKETNSPKIIRLHDFDRFFSTTTRRGTNCPYIEQKQTQEEMESEIQRDLRKKLALDEEYAPAKRSKSTVGFKRISRFDAKVLANYDRESVENLESWSIKKGSWQLRSPEYREKIGKKVEKIIQQNSDSIMRLHSKDRSLSYRNLMRGGKMSTNPCKLLSSATFKDNTDPTIRMKFVSPALPKLPSLSNPEEYESIMGYKYKKLTDKVNAKRKVLEKQIAEKNSKLKSITQFKIRIREIKLADKMAARTDLRERQEAISKADNAMPSLRILEMGMAQEKNKRMTNIKSYSEQISQLRKEIENHDNEIAAIGSKIEGIKYEVAILREEQNEHFHSLLKVGRETRQEGLIWIIKAIWALGKNVNLSKLPPYLDEKAIEYLFDYARKDMYIERLKQELAKVLAIENPGEKKKGFLQSKDIEQDEDSDNSSSEVTSIEIDRQIEQLRRELRESREREYRRLSKEFIHNNYDHKYSISLETMLCAMFGFDFMKREIDKFPRRLLSPRCFGQIHETLVVVI